MYNTLVCHSERNPDSHRDGAEESLKECIKQNDYYILLTCVKGSLHSLRRSVGMTLGENMPVYAINKKARFDYEILDTVEAGLVLTGTEVKSIRSKQAKLTGGYIMFYGDEPQMINVHIPKYKFSSPLTDYNPERNRKILLNRKEISYLKGKTEEKGLTIVPITLYTKGRHIKLEIGIAKGKKVFDKRRSIKDRDQKREMGRIMKDL